MKKFLIILLILVILSSIAFFFGWVQFSVPVGQYGVILSKTHGIDPKLVQAGEFRWIWYKLLPTNVKIAVFNIENVRFPISFNSSLPSGSTYANFFGITNADFSWNFSGEITFNIKPEMLTTLAGRHSLNNQDDLNAHIYNSVRDIELMIIRILSSAGTDSQRLENIMAGNMDTEMLREIRNRFPEINDFSLIIHSAKFPDFVLYSQIRLLYEDFLASQRETVSSSFGSRVERHIETQFRFEELERYGDLLTRYPVLMDYMMMEGSINRNQ